MSLILLLSGTPAVAQTTITVNTLDGGFNINGNCSLYEAVFSAVDNLAIDACPAGTGVDIVDFSVTGTIALTDPLPSITESTTIVGPGLKNLTIDGSGIGQRIVDFFSGTTSIVSQLSFSGGKGFSANTGSIVSFRKCSISGMDLNSTGSTMNVTNADVTIDQCTVSNSSMGSSGTIYVFGGDITITNSTFEGNSATFGGAVGVTGNSTTGPSNVTIENSTFTNNSAEWSGGALWITGDSTNATITSSTITGNTADSDMNGSGDGGGIMSTAASMTVKNTIIAGNSDSGVSNNPDLAIGPFTSGGYNIIGDCTGACGDFNGTGDQEGTSGSPIDPLLDALASNGGLTQTMALLTGSPAIDAGSCTGSDRDQRNYGNLGGGVRIVDVPAVLNALDGCDIGAYEVDGVTLPVELVSFDAIVDDGRVVLSWQTLSETNNAGFAVEFRDRSDGTTAPWTQVSWLDGNGSSARGSEYTYVHSDLRPGTYQFRLKQTDFDGSFAYSDEIEISIELIGTDIISTVYPNPFNEQSTFSLVTAEDQRIRIDVVDLLGRRVNSLFDGELESDVRHEWTLDGSDLTSGIYFVQVRGERFVEHVRVLVTR